MTTDDLTKIAGLLSSTLVGFFALQRSKHALEMRQLEKRHADELMTLSQKKIISDESHVANNRALERLERLKEEMFDRFERAERKIEKLEDMLPKLSDLLDRVHQVFESIRANRLQAHPIGEGATKISPQAKTVPNPKPKE